MFVGKVGRLEKYTGAVANVFVYIAMGALFVMMAFGTGDVLGRYFFNKPIKGTFELFEILLVAVVLLSLAHTQRRDEHITMTLLWTRLSPRIQHRIGLATSIVLTFFFCLVTWKGIEAVIMFFHDGRLVVNLMVPRYIPLILAPVGTLALSMILGAQAIRLIKKIRKGG